MGLDPIQIVEIRQLIQELGQKHTVILSSHILQEISAVCDWVIMISKGKIVASDAIDNLLSGTEGNTSIHLETEGNADTIRKILQKIKGVEKLSFAEKGSRLSVTVSVGQDAHPGDDIFMALRHENLPVHSMTDGVSQNTLEDLFIQLAGESLDAGAAYAAEKAAKKEKKSNKEPTGTSPLGPAYYTDSDKADPSSEDTAEESDTYEPLFEDKEENDK